ncbi:MAG: DUF5615 family PIN-like protein [Planctomycetes bacterium]|nr:DUF5615 family PIN-like protein [Planctomycetota bacterium]
MEIRYHLDEGIPNAVVNGLRQRGIDAVSAADADLLAATDEEHIAYAIENQRVLFCCDDDFLRLASAGVVHAGIVYCHQRDRTIGQIVMGLVALWRDKTAEEMKRQIHFL